MKLIKRATSTDLQKKPTATLELVDSEGIIEITRQKSDGYIMMTREAFQELTDRNKELCDQLHVKSLLREY